MIGKERDSETSFINASSIERERYVESGVSFDFKSEEYFKNFMKRYGILFISP